MITILKLNEPVENVEIAYWKPAKFIPHESVFEMIKADEIPKTETEQYRQKRFPADMTLKIDSIKQAFMYKIVCRYINNINEKINIISNYGVYVEIAKLIMKY